MDKNVLTAKVFTMIRKSIGEEECSTDMDLMDDIGLSSIDVMDLIAKCEAEFRIKISSRDLRKVYTPGDLIDLIEAKL